MNRKMRKEELYIEEVGSGKFNLRMELEKEKVYFS